LTPGERKKHRGAGKIPRTNKGKMKVHFDKRGFDDVGDDLRTSKRKGGKTGKTAVRSGNNGKEKGGTDETSSEEHKIKEKHGRIYHRSRRLERRSVWQKRELTRG